MSPANTRRPLLDPTLQGFLKKSLLLHVIILALIFVLPYLHTPPKVKPPQVVEAVLVSAPPKAQPKSQPKPAKKVEPQPAPPQPTTPPPPTPDPAPVATKAAPKPAPQPIAKPEPAPKPVAKSTPEKTAPPEPVKPKPLIKPTPLNSSAFDKEMQNLQKEAQEAEIRKEIERANQQQRQAANLAVRDKYQRLINQRVVTKWNRPLSARNGMVTVLRISVLPGGEVSNVITIQSSGDPAFDASAEEAVRRASPLPVPDDPAIFRQYFSSITFKFNPEDL